MILADGTGMLMDAGTRASARISRTKREVVLASGRIELTVAKGAAPFEVRSSGTLIHDIGTTFQVERDDAGVRVSLLDGSVSITSPTQPETRTLRPGEQVNVSSDGQMGDTRAFDLTEAAAWTRGKLVFRRKRLSDLLSKMNRYSPVSVKLGDSALAELEVSGSFRAGDQETLVRALVTGWGLREVREAGGVVTLYSTKSTSRQGTRVH
ncbi:FecR domain-containing protein [Bacillus sp. NP157]|nr:FecR domain-containing protein [Bacillus sp. NP157]